MDKKYIEQISSVEDLDGTSAYLIGSDNPIPKNIVLELNSSYIGISRLEFSCKLHGFVYEDVGCND